MLSGLITEEQIAALKEAFPETTLYKYPLKMGKVTHDIIYRPIDEAILGRVTELVNSGEPGQGVPIEVANEMIFDHCVVWPRLNVSDKASLRLGDIPQIVKNIQEKSGFVDITITGQVIGPDVLSSIIYAPKSWGEPTEADLERLATDEITSQFEQHRVRVGRYTFVVRPLTRACIGTINQSPDRHITAAKVVTLWPFPDDTRLDWTKIPAGIIAKLGAAAEDLSGWDTVTEVEEI